MVTKQELDKLARDSLTALGEGDTKKANKLAAEFERKKAQYDREQQK